MRLRLRIWVVLSEDVKFGEGRAELLRLIDELGSIKQAVARLGMSYRSAWGYIEALERAAGVKFLERTPGGGARGGARLTRAGRAFLRKYERLAGGLERTARARFDRTFGGR